MSEERPTKSGNKHSRQEVQQIHEDIRRMQRNLMRPNEMIEALKRDHKIIDRSTLYRHLAQLREQDKKWMEEQARGAFTSAFRGCLEILEDQVRELIVIRESSGRPWDKIQATLAIRDIALDMIELQAQGPTVLAVQRRGEPPKRLTTTPAVAQS